jgi:hypothetical protein
MSDIPDKSLDLPALNETPSWKRSLEKAMHESDGVKLVGLIHATELVIFDRWQELGADGHAKEREAMRDAAENLRSLKVHRLGWPDWS